MKINDNIVNQIRSYPMSELAKKLGYEVIASASNRFMMLCPFHNDKKMGSFYIFDNSRYKCFACGETGDNFNLVAKYLNDNKQPSDFISVVIFIHNLLQGENVDLSLYKIDTFKSTKNINILQNLKDKRILEEQKNVFYKVLLKMSKLDDIEKDILINNRCLGEKTIEKIGYSSLLTREKAYDYKQHAKMLPNIKLFNKSIPGLYVDYNDELTPLFQTGRGIFIPIRNEDGLIVALQIRVNESKNGNRYFWYTSSINDYNKKYIKEGWGATPENDFSLEFNTDDKVVVLTEGHFKQLELSNIYDSVISMQGITQTKKIKDYFNSKKISNEVLEERLENYSTKENNEFYESLPFKANHEHMIVYLDQDVWQDELKYKQLYKMFDYLLENNLLNKITIAYWDERYGKIDDLIINNNYDLVSYKEYKKRD